MFTDPALLPYFISEDLFVLEQDRQTLNAPAATTSEAANIHNPAPSSNTSESKTEHEQKSMEASPTISPKLIFGKNLKKMLVLVQDPAHPVMERADGLLLKDILKAVGYSFDDVAIVNIANCKGEQDWQAVNELPYTHLFSFGVSHPKLPATTALAPYELESSGEKRFLLTDKLSVLRDDRSRKINLWNLLKKIFV